MPFPLHWEEDCEDRANCPYHRPQLSPEENKKDYAEKLARGEIHFPGFNDSRPFDVDPMPGMRRRYNQRRAQALYGGGLWGMGTNGMQNMYGMGGNPVQNMFGMGGNMGRYGNQQYANPQQYGIPQYGYPQLYGYSQQNNPQHFWNPQHNYAIPYAQGFGISSTGYGEPQYYSYAYSWPPIGGYTFWRGDKDPDDRSDDSPKAITLSTDSSAEQCSKASAPDEPHSRKPNTSTDRNDKPIGRSEHAPIQVKAAASKDRRRTSQSNKQKNVLKAGKKVASKTGGQPGSKLSALGTEK
ncbi:hypothetical protein Slin14017_G122580 [Septoria linicola]|nr:hypothetical protein Slin14017_G122580 [Septoria linicola]